MAVETVLDSIVEKIVIDMAKKVADIGVSAILSGNNGPYHNNETVVRNMAHWCVTFSEYYKKTSEDIYRNVTIMLADAILESPEYNKKGVYRCRTDSTIDEVNGVIGAAWIIEGLICATRITDDIRYYERAKEMFLVVPFNEKLAIWNRINTKNEKLSVDVTFNHQLWFAAAGSMINAYKNDATIAKRIDEFIKRLDKNITVRKDGRIGHFTMNDKNGMLGYAGRVYRDVKNDLLEKLCKPSLAYKEAGYHAFNLYGFAILKENYNKDIPFFATGKFKKTLDYICSDKYIDILCDADRNLDETKVRTKLSVPFNVFSFSYNSSAFELGRIYTTFGRENEETKAILNRLCEKQLEYTYNEETGLFDKNTDDPITLTTRIYEYIAG